MSLLDKFRPEWKHTDAEVRADAVRQLGPSAKQTLAEIARTDADAKIRAIAIKKIEDVGLLREIAASDSDAKVQAVAQDRAHQLLLDSALGEDSAAALDALGQISSSSVLVQVVKAASLEDVRRQALAGVSSSEDLLEVARTASDTDARKEAIARLEDAATLKQVALHEQYGEIALAALARIDDPRTWLEVSEKGEVKTVREEAARRLDALSDEEHPTRVADRQSRQKELIAKVEALAGSTDWESARDGIEAARSSWLEMGAAEDDELGRRFFEARERFIQRFKEHLEESRKSEAPESGEQEAQPQETAAADATAQGDEPREDQPEAAAAEAGAQEDAVSKPAAPASEPVSEGAAEAAGGAEEAPVAAEAGGETPQAAPQAAAETDSGTQALEAAEPASEAETTAAAPEQAKVEEKPPETPERAVARLKSLCDRLDSMVSSEQLNLRKAERALRETAAALAETGPIQSHEDWGVIKKHLESARDTLTPRVRQIEQEEEWKRWANVPLQEGLCERMEALIETEDLAHASRELRVLSEEWKTVATVPREKSEELWQRFRGAREKVRERVKVFLQEQDKQRKENLVKKTALCEQAEALAESTEWRDTANKLKALQAEWKAIGPVPRKVSDQIWKRFRAACDQFFNRRKEHFSFLDKEREENLSRKTALCEEAEALAESTDWETTTNKLKRLQARWKEVGPVPRKVSDEVWRRFRAACDKFFDRRSRRDELPLEDNLKQKEAALGALEALLPVATAPAAAAEDGAGGAGPAEAKGEPAAQEPAAETPEGEKAETRADADAEEGEAAETPEGEKAETRADAEETPAADDPPAEPTVPENLGEVVRSALGQWNSAGEIPSSRRGALEKRFAEVSSALIDAYPENLEGTPLDPNSLAEKRQGMVARAKSLLDELRSDVEASKAAPQPTLADLAQQLKEAFAANTIRKGAPVSDSADTFRKTRRKLDGLRARWNGLPGRAEAEVAKRFDKIFKDLAKLEKEQAG